MEAENSQSIFSFGGSFGPQTYNIEITQYGSLADCKKYYDVPKHTQGTKVPANTSLKIIPLDIFKVTDINDEDASYVCEEFFCDDPDFAGKLQRLLKTTRKHPNLFEFSKIIVLEKEKRLWLLSVDEDLQFITRKLNRETKNPFSLPTIMKFCHDMESALDHLSRVRNSELNVFDDILKPFITTTGILYSKYDREFKIGLSLSFVNHYESEKKYLPDEADPCKSKNREEKEITLVQSLGRVMLEVAIGYYTKLNDSRVEIVESPVTLEIGPLTVDKLKDVISEIRKDALFSLNQMQVTFLARWHIPRIALMIQKKTNWKEAIDKQFFRTRIWSYRVNPVKVLDNFPDKKDWSFPKIDDSKADLLQDGINNTLFLEYFARENTLLTSEIWKEYLEDEQKVNRFMDHISSTFKSNLIQNKKDDALVFTFEKSLDIEPGEEARKGTAKIEVTALWSKNCIVHKCSLDILTLSVEFGDDLNHLSSVIASTFPYMSTEIDEQRRIVFRIANTLSPGDRVIDMMIDTLDQMLITINTVRLKFDDCIKGEKFGRLAKAATFIAEEIVEKIEEYQNLKRTMIIEENKKKRDAIFS